LAESIRDSAETLSTWQMDIPFRTPDGEHKWVRGRAAPRREAGGLVVWIGVFVDVTEQKLAEAELQRERQILRTLIDSLPDVVYFKDHEARYLVVNEPMARLAGCKSPQNLIGKSPHDLFPKKIADDFAAADREVFESGRKTVSATQELTTPDGPNRYYVTTKVPLRDDQGRVIGLVGVGHDITEHIQADASLRASEASLRRSQALGRIGSWRLDIADDSLTWSDETYRMFGVPAGTALKYGDFIALVHPGDRDAVWNAWRQTRMDGPGEFEYRIVVDAEVFWVREVAEHQFDSAGKLCAIAGTVQDITDRKITSDALEILSTGVAGLVGEQFHNEVARQIARLFGVEIGFVCKRVNDPGHRVRPIGFSIDDQIVQRLEYDLSKTPCEYVMGEDATFCCGLQKRFPENEFIREHIVESYAAVPMFDREGRQIGHLGLMSRKPLLHPERLRTILRLFAVRTAAEMERARAEARFRDLVEFAPDALFLTNRDGVITLINRQAETVFGYTRAELIGQPVEVLMPKKTHVDHVHLRQRYLDTPTPRPMGANRSHLYARRKDGTVFPADISLSPIQSDEGLSVVAAVRDTTDRVRAEEERGKLEGQLRQAQKMDAIGTLAGGIAHDFNNLLTAILGNAELLMMLIEPGHPHLENLEPIRAASLRARDLVKQILTFSRRVEGERLPILVQEIANEAVKLLRSTIPAMVELITDIDPACPLVVADATQVHQVIMNLCTNAWHALPERGGRISLRVEPVEVTGEKAATHPDLRAGPHVRLTVTDNGHGMSKETIERIFEPFFTTKKHGKGTGLGLSVVHGIVDAHQGAILVESTPGEGTTFEVYLPAQKAVTAAALAKKQPLQFGRGEHILMVDDEVSVGKMVEAMLTRLQYRVTRHIHPTEMLAEFQKSPESFDLVITDMAMPEMSGADLAGALIRIRSNIPIILISGMLDRAHEAVARANGVRVILQKPMSQEALSNALHDLLEKEPPPG
jgi:PAS domain S-box-containing protein